MAARRLAVVDGVFILVGPSCKIETVRTAARAIFWNDSPTVKLDDRGIKCVCRERESSKLRVSKIAYLENERARHFIV